MVTAEVTASQVLAQLAGKLLPATWVLAGSESERYLTVQELVARRGYTAIDRAHQDVLGMTDPNQVSEIIRGTDQLIHLCNARHP
jgi:hypothetical protein